MNFFAIRDEVLPIEQLAKFVPREAEGHLSPVPRMNYLLFPGRHLVNTVFQGKYLLRALSGLSSMPGLMVGRSVPSKLTEVIFAITSANQESSRYNPVPFHIRAIGVDRFARTFSRRRTSVTVYSASPITGRQRTLPCSHLRRFSTKLRGRFNSPPKIAWCFVQRPR